MSDARLFATVRNVFTPSQLQAITNIGDALLAQNGSAPTGTVYPHRSCEVAWIKPGDMKEFFLPLADAVLSCNAEIFKFDLREFVEPLQYTVYESGDHFGWHIDKRPGTPAPRKLSLTLQLSNPDDYVGGDLEVRTDEHYRSAFRDQGSLTIFPSWLSHRVTKIESGVRKTLVAWVAGPNFR